MLFLASDNADQITGHVLRLAAQLDAAARGRWEVRPEFEVVIDDGPAATVRVPDIVVAPPDLRDHAARIEAGRALAVVEVLSVGTRRLDRVLKVHEYAEAGVPCYLLVEPAHRWRSSSSAWSTAPTSRSPSTRGGPRSRSAPPSTSTLSTTPRGTAEPARTDIATRRGLPVFAEASITGRAG